MPKPTKRARSNAEKSGTAMAKKAEMRQERMQEVLRVNRQEKRGLVVENFLEQVNNHPEIGNRRGQSRTYEENCIIVLAMAAFMQLWNTLTISRAWDVWHWTWGLFDVLVGQALKLKAEHVRMLRVHFCRTWRGTGIR
jgi:hypothetical protein